MRKTLTACSLIVLTFLLNTPFVSGRPQPIRWADELTISAVKLKASSEDKAQIDLIHNLGLEAEIAIPAGSNVQTAVDAAQCGDTITLQKGANYFHAGRLTFTDRGCTQDITLTTSDPASIPTELSTAYPHSYSNGKFLRMTPAMAVNMPKLISTTNDPIIFLDRGAGHWRFDGFEITNADNGIQHTVFVNDGSTNAFDIPHHNTFERLYIHPAEEDGTLTNNIQYRSTEMAFILSIAHSTFKNLAVQGFTGHNRYPEAERGTYRLNANSMLFIFARDNVVENCLLEANGQVFIAGEGSVNPENTATATNVTYTSARFSNTGNLNVGDLFAIFSRRYSDNHLVQHPGDPVQVVPRVGHFVNGQITSVDRATGDVTFTRLTGGLAYRQFSLNLWGATGGSFTLNWMGQTTAPIAHDATPANVRAALEALANVDPEDFYVRSAAQGWPYGDFEIHFGKNDNGQPSGQWQFPTPVNPIKINHTGLTGYKFQPWIAVHSAENFSPLENSADGTLIDVPDEGARVQWKGFISDNNVFRRNIIAHHKEWTDVTGSVKGFAEIKGGTRTWFDGCIFSGEGTTIIWTVRNQGDGGSAPWSEVSLSKVTSCLFDITGFTNGFFLKDSTYQNVESHDILVDNNLFLGPDTANPDNPWIYLVSGARVTLTHNTVFAGGRLIQGLANSPSRDAIIRDNIFRPRHHLVPCLDGFSPCWPNAQVSHNLIINNPALEPGATQAWFDTFGANTAWVENSIDAVGFMNPSAAFDGTGDHRLSPFSPYKAGGARQASDGRDLGVDFAKLNQAIFGTGSLPSPSPTPTSAPTPTPSPSISPTPVPSPSMSPTPGNTVGIQGRVLDQDENSVVGALVSVAGQTTLSREGDGYFAFSGGIPIGSVITTTKTGYIFPQLTVQAGVFEQFYGIKGTAVSSPTPTPAPTSTPTPEPTATPTPEPTPIPSPTALPICRKNQFIGNPPTCECRAGRRGKSGKCG